MKNIIITIQLCQFGYMQLLFLLFLTACVFRKSLVIVYIDYFLLIIALYLHFFYIDINKKRDREGD